VIRAAPRFAILAPYGTMDCVASLAARAGPTGRTEFPSLACETCLRKQGRDESLGSGLPGAVHRGAS